MTASLTTMFPIEHPSRWNVFFAEENDKDLDFDEGFEEDELHQSKPPSRRPLLLILLLFAVGAFIYWTFNNQSAQSPRVPVSISEKITDTESQRSPKNEVLLPLFSENQKVVLQDKTGESMLMGNPTNSEPGPIVQEGEKLTILDGLQQLQGWIYLVQTSSGKTGWIPEEKIKAAL